MSEYLLVVEGLAESGADVAMFVDEIDYRAAMFGCAFAEPVHGYVWCNTHGWVLADEACVCEECACELMEAEGSCDPGCPIHNCSAYECACAWQKDLEQLQEAGRREVEAELHAERQAEWVVADFVSQYCVEVYRGEEPRDRHYDRCR